MIESDEKGAKNLLDPLIEWGGNQEGLFEEVVFEYRPE